MNAEQRRDQRRREKRQDRQDEHQDRYGDDQSPEDRMMAISLAALAAQYAPEHERR